MELLFWITIFAVSLAFLLKGSDWFIKSSEKIGLAAGLSPFVVGVTIVALGTSLPELGTSLFAVVKGAVEIPVANAVGSNIANILLILGIASVAAKKLVIKHSLIDIDLPLLFVTTVLFFAAAWDRVISIPEAVFLLFAFGVYLIYSSMQREGEEVSREVSLYLEERELQRRGTSHRKKQKIGLREFFFLALGVVGLFVGSKYVIEAMLHVAEMLSLAPSVIAILAIAVGTSLPELVVSVQAAMGKRYEIAIGNVLGSNVFNLLVVVAIPALVKPLILDEATLFLGLPVLAVATFFLIISGISQRIHAWEGAMYLIVYAFFVGKLFNLL